MYCALFAIACRITNALLYKEYANYPIRIQAVVKALIRLRHIYIYIYGCRFYACMVACSMFITNGQL